MTLTYDEVWTSFLDTYKVNAKDVSQSDEAIYQDIKNAVLYYNNKTRKNLCADDTSESIIGETNNDDRLTIAHYIRLVYLINNKTLYETLYQPISPDVGIRNYNTQMNALEASIKRQEDYIDQFIFNTREGLF